MKHIRLLVSTTAILPGLLMTGTVAPQSVAAAPIVSPLVLAQATPTEEEKRRKLEEEEKRRKLEEEKQHPAEQRPATVAPHAPTPPTPPAAQQKPVTPPPAPTHVAPVTPAPAPAQGQIHPPAPVTPPPAPTHVAPVTPAPAQGQAHPAGTSPAPTTIAPPPVPTHTAPVTPQPAPAQGQPHPPAAQPPASVPATPAPQTNGTPPHPNATNQPPAGQHPTFNGANLPSTMAPHFPAQQQQQPGNQPKGNGITPLQAGAIGAAAGLVGGMIIGSQVHGLGEVQQSRQTVEQNGVTFYSEPGRLIVREGDGLYVRHDETERFREFGTDVRVEQRGDETIQIVDRPDGSKIITITDANGDLLKRLRRLPNGSEIVLIDNTFRPRPSHFTDEVVVVAPPPVTIAPDRYDLDAGNADEQVIYETLMAPPVARLPRRYTLDEVRYSRDLRQYVRSVDLTTITFETASWTVEDADIGRLQGIADAINRAVRTNPNEIFLIEGHTDAVGKDVDNLSLSDRRAQAVAALLTRNFNVPPENLITQGYGSQYLKVQTDGPERANRRVTVRNVTALIASGTQH